MSIEISAEGGTFEALGLRLDVPPGAVGESIVLEVAVAALPRADESLTPLGALYTIGPPGTVFAEPVLLSLPFDRALLPDGATAGDVVVFTRQDATQPWVDLGGVVEGSLVRAELFHLSKFVPGTAYRCTSTCEDRVCGSNGCAGSCGECGAAEVCVEHRCVAAEGAGCLAGWDCAQDCGYELGLYLDVACLSDCAAAAGASSLDVFWPLVDCTDAACGFGETWASCWESAPAGACVDEAEACREGACFPDCSGESAWGAAMECGDDGCGGSCGACDPAEVCVEHRCVAAEGAGCLAGWDCAQDCGYELGLYLDVACLSDCAAAAGASSLDVFWPLVDCTDAACGFGETWASCWAGAPAGACVDEAEACREGACLPGCDGRACGDDGCGGSCGSCGPLEECADGACVPRPVRTPPTVWIEVPQDGSALGSDWLVTLVGHAEPTDGDPILEVRWAYDAAGGEITIGRGESVDWLPGQAEGLDGCGTQALNLYLYASDVDGDAEVHVGIFLRFPPCP